MTQLKNFILLTRFILKVRAVNREKGKYHRLVKKVAEKEFSYLHEIHDGSVDRLYFLKIQWYMVTNLYLGELIAGLRPQKLTNNEKNTLIYLGALMAITDLMIDDLKVKPERITVLLKGNYDTSENPSAFEQVFVLFHQKLIANIDKEKAAYIQDFSLREPQLDSKTQMHEELTEFEVHEITRKKGGTAILLTTSLLFDITERNQEAFYHLGAFIQYMNDSQDIFKDAHAGITTFISFCNNFDEVNARLKQEFDQTTALFLQTDFPRKSLYELLFNLNALYTAMLYKNKEFSRKHSNTIDIDNLRSIDRSRFNVQMFSVKSLLFCVPRILTYAIPKAHNNDKDAQRN